MKSRPSPREGPARRGRDRLALPLPTSIILPIVTRPARRRTNPPRPPQASLILLDPSRSGALTLAGRGRVVTDGGIQVNSNSPTAVVATNAGHTRPATAGKLGVPVLKVAGRTSTDASGYFSGQVVTGAPAVADPLADLPVPPQVGTVFNGLPFPRTVRQPPSGSRSRAIAAKRR